MGGTYRFVRLSVRGPPATGRFRQKSTVGDRLKGEIDRRRSIEREKGKKKKKRERRKKEKRRRRIPSARPRSSPARHRRQHAVLACVPSPPAGRQCPRVASARGSWRFFSRAGRKIEV
ncbi:hypothetical protein BHE74_00038132, partial [Ensete ventricosum]